MKLRFVVATTNPMPHHQAKSAAANSATVVRLGKTLLRARAAKSRMGRTFSL
ncbi:MAG: hypothetical protein LUD39_02055 [Opitutae bacterium]|nr:hypothetical protein [Opitutae bacterium]